MADTKTAVLPGAGCRPTEKELNASARQFASAWGQREAENQWHRLFHAITLLLVGGAIWFAWQGWTRPVERIYVKQDDTGRAFVVPGSTFAYRPSEQSLKYFLREFTYMHFGRRKATIAEEYPRSLYFLADGLANRLRQEATTSEMMKTVARSATDLEVEVDDIVLAETQREPFRATINYSVATVEPVSHQAQSRKYYTATIDYTLKTEIPNRIIQYNPIGMNIIFYRTDESFRRDAPDAR